MAWEVPDVSEAVALPKNGLLKDGQHQRQSAKRDECAKREEGCSPILRLLHAFENNGVGSFDDLVIVRLEIPPGKFDPCCSSLLPILHLSNPPGP